MQLPASSDTQRIASSATGAPARRPDTKRRAALTCSGRPGNTCSPERGGPVSAAPAAPRKPVAAGVMFPPYMSGYSSLLAFRRRKPPPVYAPSRGPDLGGRSLLVIRRRTGEGLPPLTRGGVGACRDRNSKRLNF